MGSWTESFQYEKLARALKCHLNFLSLFFFFRAKLSPFFMYKIDLFRKKDALVPQQQNY